MSRELQLYLADILVACEKVLRYTDGMEFEQFVADDRTFDAVIRNLQIIGEAVKNIPVDIRDRPTAPTFSMRSTLFREIAPPIADCDPLFKIA